MDFNKIAQEILQNIGGKDNIAVIEHCATRLRIMVKDSSLVNSENLKTIDGVKGYFLQSGQHQLIIGTGKVNKVFNIINSSENLKIDTTQQDTYNNLNIVQKILRSLADALVPLIPVLVATGIAIGIFNFIAELGIILSPELLILSQLITKTVFIFLPALVVWSTFKRFEGTPVIGMVLGLMLISPMLPNTFEVSNGITEPLKIGLFEIKGFQGTILPALIVGVLGAKIEKWIKSWMPGTIDLVFTPLLTIVTSLVASFLILGPLFSTIENLILMLFHYIITLPFGIGGAIFGGAQQALTITGLHHSIMLIETSYLLHNGINPMNALITASMAGQAGAAIAYAMSIKNKKERANKFSSIVPCFFGITEPLLFGVTLSNTKVFISGMIGGAIAGAFAMLFNVAPSVMGVTFIPAIPAYLGNNLLGYLAMIAIGMGTGMIMTKILVRQK